LVDRGNTLESRHDAAISPVLCVQCGAYALAKVDDKPLCWKCLYSRVCSAGNDTSVDIVPLETIISFDTPAEG
jgi:hypothetical protein